MNSFERLLDQIDSFIRKYYKNQMVKGAIWFVGVFLVSLLFTVVLEYFGRFGSGVRAFLLFSFIVLNLFILSKFIIVPLFRLNSFGKRINRYQASEIIGGFFPSISDRLVNTLQLNDDLSGQEGNLELIRASVAQRADSLSIVPFAEAIDFNENKRYFKFVIPVILLFFALAIFTPSVISEGGERVMNYNKVFVPLAPFQFKVDNYNSSVLEGEDLDLYVSLVGSELPEKVYLVSDQGKFLLGKATRNKFKGSIRKVVKSGSFYFVGNDFVSETYSYESIGRPTMGKFEATISYPKYLGKSDEIVNNAGDMTLPEGSIVSWSVLTKNVKEVKVLLNDEVRVFKNEGFKFSSKLRNSAQIKLLLTGSKQNTVDTNSFMLNVIKDAAPAIRVEEVKDTMSSGRRYFTGLVSDDYGLTSLYFHYKVKSKNGSVRNEKLDVRSVSGTEIQFDFGVDFIREKLALEDKVEYYFVVTDNDGVNGSKSTRSQIFIYELPSTEELNKKREEEQEQGKADLKELLKRSEEFKKDVKNLKKDLLNTNSSDWNKKNQINQLQEEHSDLLKMLEKTQQKMDQSTQEKNQLSEMDKELMEKQDLINDLLDELMDDELRKLLDDLEKLMEENKKDELQNKLNDLELSTEDMNKQLDRSLEMLKKLQVDEKIDGMEKELKELAKEQRDLKEKIEEKKISKEESEKKQNEINDKFDQLKEDLKELNKLNEELNRPMELGDTQTPKEKIEKELQEAKEKLSKGKESKAGENQENAADEMEKMAEDLNKAQEESNEEQAQEDMELLRNILESLISLSLDQEWVMNRLEKTSDTDPSYRSLGRFQRKVIDNTAPVKDSLYELAKRQPKIASFIDDELKIITTNHKLTVDDVDERRRRELGLHQQLAMTSFNNLALMLNESLQQQQQQQKNQKPGSGSCDDPGGKGMPKPGEGMNPGNMKEMLKKQLEQMEKGNKEGGKKPGDKPGEGKKQGKGGQGGEGGLGNKQIAKMAAEQNAIRRRIEELKKDLNKEGKGAGNALNPLLDELEKQQEDLINKRFSPEMINRQKDILTRLLESEKALMERGFEEKRESKSGKSLNNGNQIRFDEYNKQKLKQIELLRTIDPIYNKYYKDKATQFFNSGM